MSLLLTGAGCTASSTNTASTNNGSSATQKSTAKVPADAQTSPENLVNAFYAAVSAGDLATARAMVKPDVLGTDKVEKFFTSLETYEFMGGEISQVNGDWVNTKINMKWNGTPISGTSSVRVEEMDGKWWIVELPST